MGRIYGRVRKRRKERWYIYKTKYYKTTLSKLARKDFKKIHKNLSKLSKNSAKKLQEELIKKVTMIMENPYLYQCIDSDKKNRRFIIQKYIVFYKIENQKVIILRILSQKVNYNQKRIYRIKSTKQLEFNKRK